MGLFQKLGKLLTSNEIDSTKKEAWQRVSSEEDLDNIFKLSKEKPQIIFKHSTSCAISFFAMRSLNTPVILDNKDFDLHLIDVIRERSISQSFARKVNIQHESPQIFVVKDEEVIWHDSHNSVSAENVIASLA